MSRENLTPTTVVDKNGKRTTVHKRTSSPSSSSPKLSSARPQVSPPLSHLQQLSDEPGSMEFYLKKVIEGLPKTRKPSNKRLGRFLSTLHPDALNTLGVIREEWERGDFSVEHSLKNAMATGKSSQVNNLAFFYDKNLGEPYQKVQFYRYVQGIQEHIGLDVDATTSTESIQEQMRALLIAALNLPRGYTKHLEFKDEDWVCIVSEPLGKLLMEHPKDVDRIVKLISERPDVTFHNVQEIENLRGLMEQETPLVISDGVL